MHIPQKPPQVDLSKIIRAQTSDEAQKKLRAIFESSPVDEKGRYLHWDDMRRHNPPDGLTHEEWWTGTRIARGRMGRKLPFVDMEGEQFSYCEPVDMRRMLVLIDKQSGGILGTSGTKYTPVDGRQYLTRSLVEEPFHSSLIEGAATTREIAQQMILAQKKPKDQHERMVLNNYYGLELVKQHINDPLTVPFILELHKTITRQTLDNPEDEGRLRQRDGIYVWDETAGEILHKPPSHTLLQNRLELLCAFANKDMEEDDEFHHPIVKAVILHFMLAYDHPFADGNGRTARALFYWSVLRSGYWLLEYISISSIIAEAKIQYGQAFLQTETDSGDMTYFLLHQVKVVLTAIKRLHQYLDRKKAEIEAFDVSLKKGHEKFNQRQIQILHDMARGKLDVTTIAKHQAIFGVSYLTARQDLEGLLTEQLLTKKKDKQTLLFSPVRNIKERILDLMG